MNILKKLIFFKTKKDFYRGLIISCVYFACYFLVEPYIYTQTLGLPFNKDIHNGDSYITFLVIMVYIFFYQKVRYGSTKNLILYLIGFVLITALTAYVTAIF